MNEKIGRVLRGQMVTSVIYVLLGLCLICMPVETVNLICKLVFGIILILAGLYHIMIYVLEKMNATVLDLFSGGILLVLGSFLFFNPQVVIKLLPILLGALVLVDSIWTFKGAFRLKKRGNGMWKVLLAGSLVFIGLGIALIVNPFQLVKYTIMFAGWTLFCNGVLDLVFMIILRKGMKKEVNHAPEEIKEEKKEEDSEDVTSKASWSLFHKEKKEDEKANVAKVEDSGEKSEEDSKEKTEDAPVIVENPGEETETGAGQEDACADGEE